MFFTLFSNCIVVKGVSRSSICDLQRGKIYFIPNKIADIIGNDSIHVDLISDDESYQKWINILIAEELGFLTKNPDYYPKLSMEWNTPELIKNAIIEMDSISKDILQETLIQLNECYCKFIEFRYYLNSDLTTLIEVFPLLKKGNLRGIIIYVPYPQNADLTQIYSLINSTGLVREIIVHSAKKEDIANQKQLKRIFYTDQIIDSEAHCGQISSDYFSINNKTFAESKTYNSCLNRKVSIDQYGNIKNCPSMKKSYGNVENTNIKNLLKKDDFKEVWNITKDQIEICKNCEFRYVCTDCRAYIEDPDNLYSKPLKCGYNPYTSLWEEWSKNPLKYGVIKHYNLNV